MVALRHSVLAALLVRREAQRPRGLGCPVTVPDTPPAQRLPSQGRCGKTELTWGPLLPGLGFYDKIIHLC